MQDKKNSNTAYIISLLCCFFLGGIFFKHEFWKNAEPLTLGDLYFYQGLALAFENRDWAHFWHFHFYPAYPVLIAWFHQLFSSSYVRSARWLNIIFDGLSVFPVYLIAREIYGKRTAIFSALFWSFCWPYFRIYGDPEPVYAFFVFVSLYLVLKKELTWKNYLAATSLAAFSGLIKSEATFFVGLVFIIYFFKSREQLRAKVMMAGAGVLIYLVLTSPIWVKYYQATGEFNPNPKSKTLYFIHNPVKEYQLFLYGLREDANGLYTNGQRIYIEGDKDAFKTPLSTFVRDNFKLLFFSYFGKLGFTASKGVAVMILRIYPGAFFLFIFYWARRARDYQLKYEIWLWLWAVLFIGALSFFETWERFCYPFFPVLVIISANGLDRLINFSESGYKKFFPDSPHRFPAMLAKWLLPGFFIFWFLFYNFSGVAKFKPEKITADQITAKTKMAQKIKPTINSNAIIMCRGFPEPFTYFLDLPFWQMVIIPMSDVEDVVRYAREKKADYFFIEEADLARNPIVEPWLWGEVTDPSVKLLKHVPRKVAEEYYPAAWYQFLKSSPVPGPDPDQNPETPEPPHQDQTIMQ